MFKNLVVVAVLIAIPTSVSAGFNGGQAGKSFKNRGIATFVKPAPHRKFLKSTHGNNAMRKSERQKCLDMMLPQDGVACLKKLKAKK